VGHTSVRFGTKYKQKYASEYHQFASFCSPFHHSFPLFMYKKRNSLTTMPNTTYCHL